jgi:hypothetical protein
MAHGRPFALNTLPATRIDTIRTSTVSLNAPTETVAVSGPGRQLIMDVPGRALVH